MPNYYRHTYYNRHTALTISVIDLIVSLPIFDILSNNCQLIITFNNTPRSINTCGSSY